MKILALLALTATLAGCVTAPSMMRDHKKIIAGDGGFFFRTNAETIDRPYQDVKTDLEAIAPRCLNKTVHDQTVQIWGKTERFVRFHPGETEDSFVLAYLSKLSGTADEKAGNVMVAEVSSETSTTTKIITHHYHIADRGL